MCAGCPSGTSCLCGGAVFVFLFIRNQRQELRASGRLQRVHFTLVHGDVEVCDHNTALHAGFVNRCAVVRSRRELLCGEETQVQLLSPDVYLAVPLPGLFEQRNAAVLRCLRAMPSCLRAQGRHELGHRHTTKRVHLIGVFLKWVVRLCRGTRFVDRSAIKSARGFLLSVVVAVKTKTREKRSRQSMSHRQISSCNLHVEPPRKKRKGENRLAKADVWERVASMGLGAARRQLPRTTCSAYTHPKLVVFPAAEICARHFLVGRKRVTPRNLLLFGGILSLSARRVGPVAV